MFSWLSRLLDIGEASCNLFLSGVFCGAVSLGVLLGRMGWSVSRRLWGKPLGISQWMFLHVWRPTTQRFVFARFGDHMYWAGVFKGYSMDNLASAKLPEHIIEGSTDAGRKLAASPSAILDRALLDAFEPQKHPAWCWNAVSTTMINSFMTRSPGGGTVTQYKILEPLRAGLPGNWFEQYGYEFVDRIPLTTALKFRLNEFMVYSGLPTQGINLLLQAHGFETEHFKPTNNPAELAEFRERVKDCLNSSNDGEGGGGTKAAGGRPVKRMLLAYGRQELGLVGGGHYVPICGYDPESDRILMLDANTKRYPPKQWVKTKDLFIASASPTGYGYPRGYIVLRQR